MTPDQESTIFQDLGAIKEGIINLNRLLDSHTAQDMTQFTTMTETVKTIDSKLDKVITDMAVDIAVKQEQEKFVKKIASTRAAWVSGAIGLIYTLLQIFIPMLIKSS